MPRPRPDFDTQAFWDGCADGRLLLPQCGDCGHRRWPPGPMCPACQSRATTWIEATGRGRVYSWVVVTHPVAEVLADQVPYVVGLIELEEGVRIVGNVTGCEPDEVHADLPVEVFFAVADHGVQLPNFRPA